MFENRKPQFIPPEKDNFERILDAELAAAKLKNPTVKLEQVLQETARKFPQAYELHARRVDGDPYASSAIASDPSPYFKKVSDIYFSELRRVDPHAQYADAAAACADAYPQLYERHVAETTGLPVIQSRVTLSDREHLPAKIGNGIILDRFSFADEHFRNWSIVDWTR